MEMCAAPTRCTLSGPTSENPSSENASSEIASPSAALCAVQDELRTEAIAHRVQVANLEARLRTAEMARQSRDLCEADDECTRRWVVDSSTAAAEQVAASERRAKRCESDLQAAHNVEARLEATLQHEEAVAQQASAECAAVRQELQAKLQHEEEVARRASTDCAALRRELQAELQQGELREAERATLRRDLQALAERGRALAERI